MQKIKVIIVDDESQARVLLKNILINNSNQLEVVELCEDVPSTVKAIKKHKPQLIFLDIEMPGYSGLELHDFFNVEEIQFSIIFTTAYEQYALNAIKMQAFDYILKPLEEKEVIKSLEKFMRFYNQRADVEQDLKINASKIAVPTFTGIRFVETQHIVYLKADNTYTEMHLHSKEKIIVSRTLKNFEDVLKDDKKFFRTNKSYMINLTYISEYVKSDGGYIKLNTGNEIPISPDRVNDFLDLIRMVRR